MERFVFVAAIVVAVLFALGAMFGGPHFNFDMDFDDARASPVVALAPGRMEPATFAGSSLRLRGVAARVTVIPEDRQDFQIEIDNSAGRAPMPTVNAEGGRVTIDGQLRGRVENCLEDGGAELRGYEDITGAQLPAIIVRAPRNIDMDRGGAGMTEIGAAESVRIDLSGCSAITVADVAGELNVDVAGSGEVRAAAARRLNADVAGSGEIHTGAIGESVNVDIAGSGSVTVASLTGDLSADGAGSGNLNIQGGAVTMANIDLAGSGDVNIAAPVQTLQVSIVGSGDVTVDAAVGDVEAEIAGSGGVSVRSVTGSVRQEVWGSGNVRVGQ
jgi:hypothetical protein